MNYYSIHSTNSRIGQLELQLSSTTNLNQKYYNKKERGAYNSYFFASLLNPDISALKHSAKEKYQIHGWDSTQSLIPLRKEGLNYFYSFIIDFTYSDMNTKIPKDTLVKILEGKEFITGHLVIIEDYFHEAYSNDINIPTSKILELYD